MWRAARRSGTTSGDARTGFPDGLVGIVFDGKSGDDVLGG